MTSCLKFITYISLIALVFAVSKYNLFKFSGMVHNSLVIFCKYLIFNFCCQKVPFVRSWPICISTSTSDVCGFKSLPKYPSEKHEQAKYLFNQLPISRNKKLFIVLRFGMHQYCFITVTVLSRNALSNVFLRLLAIIS